LFLAVRLFVILMNMMQEYQLLPSSVQNPALTRLSSLYNHFITTTQPASHLSTWNSLKNNFKCNAGHSNKYKHGLSCAKRRRSLD
jgi:hypothetical protein